MSYTNVLSPFVYWAQNKTNLFIKVELNDVLDPEVVLLSKSLEFSAIGTGAQGRNQYNFRLDFHDEIKPDESSFKLLANSVTFLIVKAENEFWPRLISQPQKPLWLKIDFDRWQSSEDVNDDEVGDVRTDHPDIYNKLLRDETGYHKGEFKKTYLTFYNLFMYVGFLYVTIVLCIKYLKDGPNYFPEVYKDVGGVMFWIQFAQYLEVIHPIIGIIKGGAFIPFMQVTARWVMVQYMLEAEPRVQVQPVVFYLFLVWCSIEIIRYPYYISQLYGKHNKILTWIRYTAWILCYPIGFCCEFIICYQNLVYLDQSNKWSISLPNAFNFSFSAALALRIYMLFVLLPGLLFLMGHMYKLRRQKLSIKEIKKKKF